ncbi:pR28 [rat cytomegalovirus strain Maastricht]|uniref:PR28 n=1 Tax=Rat cytomegalovirus (strain Maastricht) TaxID=79700 RepID=Q9DWG0_RCMVM|nr:pR28 [rat cytomegalovirus strain Maastricht]AAF99129.1 pR28 [rat cytomegalovirus strain Maastricht]WEG71953.1 protein m28 [Murid betaherpesvirus 2]
MSGAAASRSDSDGSSDDVFVREPDVRVVTPCPDVRDCVVGDDGEHVVVGTARKILVDEETERRLRPVTVKHELLSRARSANRTSFEDVERCVKENGGVRVDLDDEMEVWYEVGDLATVCPDFDLGQLLRYQCTMHTARMTVIGRLIFGSGEHRLLVAVYSGGDRCYVYSEETRILYIVSERGLDELLVRHGHRHVHEMYDLRPDEDDDGCGVPLSMMPLALCVNIFEVQAFVREKVCLSTFRYGQPSRSASFGKPGGYFMVGDETGLGLAQFFPDRLFGCLRDAGYYVVGRGEQGLIVVCNVMLEVFVLLDRARVLKVANGFPGFLRDRLRTNVQPYRRAFRSGDVDLALMSVGQIRTFKCDVEYALPCAREFYHWLANVDSGPFIQEHCVPTV